MGEKAYKPVSLEEDRNLLFPQIDGVILEGAKDRVVQAG